MLLTIDDFFKFLSKINFPDILNSNIEKRDYFFNSKNEECWEWNGNLDRDGYGNMKNSKAHRCSYYFFYNQDPSKLLVCHTCDNPSCVNPNHLWLGTIKENTEDRLNKGRFLSESFSKVSKDTLLQMFEKIENNELVSFDDMSNFTGLSPLACYRVVSGKTWKELHCELKYDIDYYKTKCSNLLIEDEVLEIYNDFHTKNIEIDELSIKFQKSRHIIIRIITKKIWKNVTKDLPIIRDIRIRRLSEKEIRNIYIKFHKYKIIPKVLSQEYNIGQVTIYNIINKKHNLHILDKIDLDKDDIDNDIV